MDLSRWSLKNLGHVLGTVLDADLSAPETADEVREPFEINESSDELAREMAMLRPGAPAERVLGALAPFFEGGLCLRHEGPSTFMTSLFLFGQTFTPAESHGTRLDIGVNRLGSDRVFRMRLEPILAKLGLEPFFRLDGASAFSFRLSKDITLVLFDNRPHPWQVFAIENAFFAARETFARVSAVKTPRGLFK